MKEERLRRLNPWWHDPRAFQADPSLERLARAHLRFDRTLSFQVRLDADALYILRGPRQVGKTTVLKQLLQQAARSGLSTSDLLYVSCDRQTPDEVEDELTQWLDRTAAPDRRRLVVLDEVSDVPAWPLVMRSLWNQGLLRNVTVVASGSHALDLKGATETLPGRRGEGRRGKGAPPLDQVLMPASFRSYALARFPDLALEGALRALPEFGAHELATAPRLPRAVGLMAPHARELRIALDEYVLCGGFPLPAEELARTGEITADSYRLQTTTVGADLQRFGLSVRSAAQLARRVIDALSNPVSWAGLVAGTDIASHVTGKAYIEAFSRAFLVHEVPPIDLSTKEPVWQRERKLYPTDPFVLHTLRAWGLGLPDAFEESRQWARNPVSFGLLLEATVAAALGRSAPPALFSGLDVARRLTYLRTRGGREVDFVVREGAQWTPIEVKSRAEAKVDRNGMRLVGPGLVVTRSDTRLRDRPRLIEAPYFLFLLGGA